MADSFYPPQSLANSKTTKDIVPPENSNKLVNLGGKIVLSSVFIFSLSCIFNTRMLPVSLNLNLATAVLCSFRNRQQALNNQQKIQQLSSNSLERKYKHLACTVNNQQLEAQQELKLLKNKLSQIQPGKYIHKSHLNIITNGIRDVKRKQKQLELGAIQRNERSLEELQQEMAQLAERLATSPQLKATKNQSPDQKVDEVAIFIDGSNLYYTLKKLKLQIDFRKFLALLKGNATTYQAYFYTGVDYQDKAQLGFLAYLRQVGYQVVSKNIIRRQNGSCKANLDVELAIDMLAKADSFNTAILVSGDGDFSYAVKKIKQQGKRVELFSFPVDTSKTLTKTCDRYHNLHDVFSIIKRD